MKFDSTTLKRYKGDRDTLWDMAVDLKNDGHIIGSPDGQMYRDFDKVIERYGK